MTRFIFVTGGVVSSLGKGIASAVLAALLQSQGYRVRIRKLDPYINVDPGTMSPYQHGEVFVTDDGAETDLDLGHYERFTDVSASRFDSTTTGQIYAGVIAKERRGEYLGATIQVIPHITDAIKAFITHAIHHEDFIIAELGGTVGDIEVLPYLEALRQLRLDLGRSQTLFLHLTLLPYLTSAGELKTKPTQHSVQALQQAGIQPDLLLCRHEHPLEPGSLAKIARMCNLAAEDVIPAGNVASVHEAPAAYHAAGLDAAVARIFGLPSRAVDLSRWEKIVAQERAATRTVTIAIVAKYFGFTDAYKSLVEALKHGASANGVRIDFRWVDAEQLESISPEEALGSLSFFAGVDGILVPGGFGIRGMEGKIKAIFLARHHHIPFFGICLGMQMAVLEFARHMGGIADAVSAEMEREGTPVVYWMNGWMSRTGDEEKRERSGDLGGSMRLGVYPATLVPGSLAAKVYGTTHIHERHRHRYEVDATIARRLEEKGLRVSGWSPDGKLPEVIELPGHPWFLAGQFHPEFKSRPFAPHPLFVSFLAAALAHKRD